jgi:hypothetical protein
VITLQALIDVYSSPNFAVVDLNCGTSTCIHPFQIVLDSKLILQFDFSLISVFDYFYKE